MAAKGKRGRRIMDPAEREAFVAERREEERERIEAAVRELTSSEGWARWIRTRSRFHNYSQGNCLLISAQAHAMGFEPSYVTGYRQWQKLGRHVRKGERGIRIMAPMSVKVRKGEQPERPSAGLGASIAQGVAAQRDSIYDADRGEYVTRQAFRSVSVFDASQTDGEPLPELPSEPITGDSLAEWLPKLEAFAEGIGYSLAVESIPGGALGYHRASEKRIVTDASLAPNARVRVLVHELAHAHGATYADYPRDVCEVIVESAAMIVVGSLGLDISGESIPYIAGWASGDPVALREYAGKVDELATLIECGIGIKDDPKAASKSRELVAA
jgi:antirestriction protein ArdC